MERKTQNQPQSSVQQFRKDALILMEGEANPGFIFIVKSGIVRIESKIKFIT